MSDAITNENAEDKFLEDDAYIFIQDGNKLVVAYGEVDENISMDLDSEEEVETVKRLIADRNFWANFLTSLSAALATVGKERLNKIG